MPATNEAVLTEIYSDEIKERSLVKNATGILKDEILRFGGIAPPVIADWSVADKDEHGRPIFLLRLLDFPGDPQPVEGRFTESALRLQLEQLRIKLDRLLGEFLGHRARRQVRSINTAISGDIGMFTHGG
jgi:hypothetical protein